MRVVELFGPPGVGKTTLARQVPHRPAGFPALSGGVPRGTYRAAYRVLVEDMTERLRPFLSHTGRVLAAVERIVASQRGGRWLLEEGSAQRANVWALIGLAPETRAAYVEALPVEQVTVCLCLASAETIVHRGAHRGRHGIPLAQAPLALDACLAVADRLEQRGATVHRFDMEQPVAENARRLREVLGA